MKVILADDHALVRKGLRDCLALMDEEWSVTEASSLKEVCDILAAGCSYDLAILDLYMPGMDACHGLDAVRELCPILPVLIISGSVDHADALAVLRHGAAGFVPKTLELSAIQQAVQLVLSGERFLPSMLLDDLTGPERPMPPTSDLTARETEVWRHIKDGISNKEIGRILGLSEVTVKLHVRSLFRKLDVSNRTMAARKYYELMERH